MTVNCQDKAKSSDIDLGDQEDDALFHDAGDDNVADNNALWEDTDNCHTERNFYWNKCTPMQT